VISESPAGAPTEKWRFPVRNRLLAAMSQAVVVVESRHQSGSRHTVEAALALGRPVGAVPGSIRSASSEGTNALLADGAFVVCSTADVLVALSLAGIRFTTTPQTSPPSDSWVSPEPAPGEETVAFEALTTDPASLDDLLRVTQLNLPTLCGALERLARAGLAHDVGGWWLRV
jgi:DNA processing protein